MATRANQVGGSDYTSGALREDLANFITLVSAEKTPHLSMLSTNKASNPRHEWQVDTLQDPNAGNAQSGAFQFDSTRTDSSLRPDDITDRLSNYTQVFGKQVHVEGSLLRSNPAGAKNWFQYAVNKRKVEIRRDIEAKHLLWNKTVGSANADINAIVANTGDTRSMSGLAAYAGILNDAAATNGGLRQVSRAAAASDNVGGTFAQGVAFSVLDNADRFGVRAPVARSGAPTDSAVSLEQMNSIFQVTSENGGMLNTAQIPTGMKVAVTNLLIAGSGGAAQRRADEMAAKLNIAVDTVMVEYGYTIDLVSNYIMQNHAGDASSMIYFYDSSKVKRTVLNPFDMEQDGTARYGKGAILFCDETLEASDPSSVAMLVNVT